ncbi:MAG TPA: lysylphosphatidylglycerol synthase domain-containing protein [Streptosporangiaceae bacterium]
MNRAEETRRRGDTAAARVPVVTGGRARFASRRSRSWAWVLAAGVVMVVAVRVPGVASDVRAAFAYLDRLHLSWLCVAVTAQIASLAGAVAAQRQLLAAGGARLPWRTVSALVLASTGLARTMPAGPITGGAWQAREYRRRGAGTVAGVWAVLAGGFTSTVAVLAMLLAGAAVAGVGALPVFLCAAGVLAAGAAGLTAAPRRAHGLSGWLGRRHHRWPSIGRLAEALAGLSRHHARPGWATGVMACTAVGLLADAGVLTACFGLAGLPVPWRGLLLAYAAGQLAGRLVPLPGGLGGVEGGLLGALTLTGTPPAAAAAAIIIYRVAGYWAVGVTGAAVAAALARRPSGPGRQAPALSGQAVTTVGKALRR